MSTLLQKAQAIRNNGRTTQVITGQHEDLALAWAKGEIGLKQVNGALGKHGGYNFLATALRQVIVKKVK